MLVTESCPTLCEPMDFSPPGSSVHGILQARILEWVAITISRDLPNPGTEPRSPALQVDSLLSLFSSVQSLSRAQLFVTPWTAECQVSLSITNSRSLLKLMSIKLVMPSNHLILCRPLLLLPSIFPSITVFPMSQFFASGGQSIGVLASASVLPMNISDLGPA